MSATSIWRSSIRYQSTETSQALKIPVDNLSPARLVFLFESLKFERTAEKFLSGFDFIYSNGTVVGRGASFTASMPDPQGFTTVQRTPHGRNLLKGQSEPHSRSLIFKKARSRHLEDNHVDWKSIILELRALSFPPIQAHPNVVQLLGVGWDVMSPVLIMECATHGTLASLEHQYLQELTRLRLCHDVARGLHFLHVCSITHGDVKTENVLVFKHPQRIVVAKLGDFGCCVLNMEDRSRLPGGTEPWNAPEWRDTIEKSLFCKTDIYSFGPLFWRVLVGFNPFISNIFELPQTPAAWFKAVQELKLQDAILPLAVQSVPPSVRAEAICAVFRNSLGKNASDRDLVPVLAAFRQMETLVNNIEQSESVLIADTQHRDLVFWMQKYSNSHLPSEYLLSSKYSIVPDQCCQLAYPLRKLVLDDLHRLTSEAQDSADPFFLLFAMTLILSHSLVEDSRAFAFLVEAARQGSVNAKEVLYRFAQGLHQEIPCDINIEAILQTSMLGGSFIASEDLLSLNPVLHATTLHELRYNYGGVGVFVFKEVTSLLTTATLDALINSKNGRVDNFVVETSDSMHKQGLLHVAAGCGLHDIVVRLLTHHHASVDKRSTHGETALLVACRSGHAAVSRLLMDHGASVSIASASGETPLHWLCSFDDQDISSLASRMCELGANIDAHAEAQQYSELDYCEGTALDRAVARQNSTAAHVLLQLDATISVSSLGTACASLSTSVLRALLELQFTRSGGADQKSIGQILLSSLIKNGSKMTLVAHQGPRYPNALRETIRVLCIHGADCSEVDNTGTSALFLAVSLNRLDIVKCLIEREFLHDINQARSSDHRTALHEAVAIGSVTIFELLLENDADFKQLWGPWNALHLCSRSCDDSAIQLASRLLSLGLEVDLTTEAYETPFHAAVLCKSYALADFLLSKGARLGATFRRAYGFVMKVSYTLLGFIVHCNLERNIESLQYILKHLRPHCREHTTACSSRSWTILHVLASVPKKHRDDETNRIMMTYLMEWLNGENGANIVNCQDTDEQTALHLAIWNANVSVVEQLLVAGADPHILDKLGRSPRAMARFLRQQATRTTEFASYSAPYVMIDDMIEGYVLAADHPSNSAVDLAEQIGMLDLGIAATLKMDDPHFEYVNDTPPTAHIEMTIVVSQDQISRTRILLRRILPTNVIQTVMEQAGLDEIQVLTRRVEDVEVRATSTARIENLYLTSASITGVPLTALVIATDSRDQGDTSTKEHRGTYDHSSSWFEVGLLRGKIEFGRRYQVQVNVHGVPEFKRHQNVWGANHPLVACAQKGDRIGLWAVAQYPAWSNIVREAGIVACIKPFHSSV